MKYLSSSFQGKKQDYAHLSWWLLYGIPFIAYIIFRFPFFAVNAFVPDETWHVGHMASQYQILSFDNYQGFGALYWIFGKVITKIFGASSGFFTLRYFSFFSYLFSTLIIFNLSASSKKFFRLLVLLFWFSLPMAWWAHKLIMPEFFGLFFLSLIAHFLFKNKEKFSFLLWFAAGLTVGGIKLNFLPCVGFFFFCYWGYNGLSPRFLLKKAPVIAGAFILGFLLSSPLLIFNPKLYLANLSGNGSYFNGINWPYIKNLFFGMSRPSWDMVFFGGINETVINVASLALLAFLVLWRCSINLKIAFLFSLLATALMLQLNGRWVSYYIFPFMLVPFWSLSQIGELEKKESFWENAITAVILIFAIALNVPQSYRNIQRDRFLSKLFDKNLNINSQKISKKAISFLKKHKSFFILNNSEVGANSHFKMQLDFNEIRQDIDWLDAAIKKEQLTIWQSSATSMVVEKIIKDDIKRILIVTGKRLAQNPDYNYLSKNVLEKLKETGLDAEIVASSGDSEIQFELIQIAEE